VKLDTRQHDPQVIAPDSPTRIWTVPTFRPVGRRILQLLEDPLERSSEIADLVLTDASLTVRVLSEANRAVAPTGVGITSIPVSLEVIGREALSEIVLGLVAGAALAIDSVSLELFRHALVTSLVAESVARVMGTVNPDTARVVGLLHDLGAWNPDSRHDDAGVHAKIGARALRKAGLPDEICRSVALHHEAAGAPGSDRAEELRSLLMLADRVATALCVSREDVTHSADLDEGVDPHLRVLAKLALERSAREVADGMLVLGTLLGIPALTLDSIVEDCRRLAAGDGVAPLPPPGLAPEIRRGLDAIRQSTNEPEALRILMRVVRDAPGVRNALLVLEDSGEAMLEGHPDKRPFFLRVRDLAKIAENITTFVSCVYEGGASIIPRAAGPESVFDAFKASALLAVPVKAAKTPVGIILVPNPTEHVTSATATGLGLVARATGDVLETLQLSRGSYLMAARVATDELTGVLNRGPFFERFSAEVRAANRYRRALALAMIDIDCFKGWNDKYGHQVGDRILRDVSKTIRDCARERDVVGRYGGDEFVVSLPGCTTEQAAAFAERVRERVGALGLVMRESCYELELSVSIGVASTTTWPCESDVLLFRADHALYRAKAKGRNCVCADQV
jgi:diguanylate cyclase (GGDEF)-like protein/putative nucleotidyltransferase with HDIG domain